MEGGRKADAGNVEVVLPPWDSTNGLADRIGFLVSPAEF